MTARALAAFRAAACELRRARHAYDLALKAAFPAGAAIDWDRGGHQQSGIVLHHGYSDKLRVRNSRTGAELWIYAHDIYLPPAAYPKGSPDAWDRSRLR